VEKKQKSRTFLRAKRLRDRRARGSGSDTDRINAASHADYTRAKRRDERSVNNCSIVPRAPEIIDVSSLREGVNCVPPSASSAPLSLSFSLSLASACTLNVVFASGRANVTRPRIDESVFQLDGILRASAEQASGRGCGLPRDIKDSKCFPPSGLLRRSERPPLPRTHDIKRDTAKMGTLIVETSESEWPWAGAVALILLALNFHIQSCHPPLGPRPVPAPDINPTCNCVMPSLSLFLLLPFGVISRHPLRSLALLPSILDFLIHMDSKPSP